MLSIVWRYEDLKQKSILAIWVGAEEHLWTTWELKTRITLIDPYFRKWLRIRGRRTRRRDEEVEIINT